MSNTITSASSAATPQTNPASITSSVPSKDMFLKLLVAQIKNQDPLQPADGLQFVTQLAQFSGLEQTIEMRQDLSAIRTVLEAASPTAKQE